MYSKGGQLDTDKQDIPCHVLWQQSGAMWHKFDSTAPMATCNRLQHTKITSGCPSELHISPRPSERQWRYPAHKLVLILKKLVRVPCDREAQWCFWFPESTWTQSGFWGGGVSTSFCAPSTRQRRPSYQVWRPAWSIIGTMRLSRPPMGGEAPVPHFGTHLGLLWGQLGVLVNYWWDPGVSIRLLPTTIVLV